jgi:hypothetical protein
MSVPAHLAAAFSALDSTEHHDALLERGRCGQCAELAPRVAILRARTCAHCGGALRIRGSRSVLERLEARGRGVRVAAAVAVGIGHAVAGLVPMLASIVTALALLAANLFVVRAGLSWLPFARRLWTRLTLKLLFAALVCVSLVANVVVAPLFGFGSLVLGLLGTATFVVYLEAASALLRKRLELQARGAPVTLGEWGLPAGMLTGLGAATFVLVALPLYALERLASADWPSASEITRAVLED